MRSSLFAFAACIVLLALPGCHRGRSSARTAADVSFTPYGVAPPDPATESAIPFEEGDKHALSKAGAQYVGEMKLDAKKAGSRRFQRAASEAARVGATHYLLVESAGKKGRFALFRVDPDRWDDLPESLRPATYAGEPTSTTTITSAPLR